MAKSNTVKKPQEQKLTCRLCEHETLTSVIDLGWSPLANNYRTREELDAPLTFHPLHAVACSNCGLMQLTASPPPEEHFSGYRYFSSYSATMVEHARQYAQQMIKRFGLSSASQVMELASNDGYLLQHFKAVGIPVLGIEPASNVAEVARRQHGISTIDSYFGLTLARKLAKEGVKADLLTANNVLAHVPDPNDFVAGMAVVLAPEGVITVEFPDVANLLAFGQFDTIYHEHISYLSLPLVQALFARHGLRVFDAEAISVHGGSLRVYACHETAAHTASARLGEMLGRSLSDYAQLAPKANTIKLQLLSFLTQAKREGKTVSGYGAAAKGNTLLNFCGIKRDLLACVADASPHKQGLYLPGSAIPIVAPEEITRTRPDYLLILPWNIRQEVMQSQSHIRQWGGRFVTAIPELEIL